METVIRNDHVTAPKPNGRPQMGEWCMILATAQKQKQRNPDSTIVEWDSKPLKKPKKMMYVGYRTLLSGTYNVERRFAYHDQLDNHEPYGEKNWENDEDWGDGYHDTETYEEYLGYKHAWEKDGDELDMDFEDYVDSLENHDFYDDDEEDEDLDNEEDDDTHYFEHLPLPDADINKRSSFEKKEQIEVWLFVESETRNPVRVLQRDVELLPITTTYTVNANID